MLQVYMRNWVILFYILNITIKAPVFCFGNVSVSKNILSYAPMFNCLDIYPTSHLFKFFTQRQSSFAQCHRDGNKFLRPGKELWRESMPLNGGSRVYQLRDLKPQTWYEVKISYPASIPASFAIQLEKDTALNNNRRLLNTEKLIFKTESNPEKTRVLVTVEPEGFVAIPHVPDRPFIIFNIVCDELLLGIPQQAWWVVVLAIICLGIAFLISFSHLPYLLPKDQKSIGTSKTS